MAETQGGQPTNVQSAAGGSGDPTSQGTSDFAKLQELDKEVRAQRAALRNEQAAINKQKEEVEAGKRAQDEFISSLTNNPIETLAQYGVDFNDLAVANLTQQNDDPNVRALAEAKQTITGLQKTVEELKGTVNNLSEGRETDGLTQVARQVLTDPKYATLQAYPNYEAEVVQLYKNLRAEGHDLTMGDAADRMQEIWSEHLGALRNNPIIQKELGIPAATPPMGQETSQVPTQSGQAQNTPEFNTVTNQGTGGPSGPSTGVPNNEFPTAEERIKAAVDTLKTTDFWTLRRNS